MSSARANHWNIVLHPTSYPVGSVHPYGGHASPPNAANGAAGGKKKRGSTAAPAHKPFKCHLCSRAFERTGHLQTHISAVHEQKQPWVCSVPGCGLSFGHRSSLSRHRKGIHKIYD